MRFSPRSNTFQVDGIFSYSWHGTSFRFYFNCKINISLFVLYKRSLCSWRSLRKVWWSFLVELGENTTTEWMKYYPIRSPSAVAGFGSVPCICYCSSVHTSPNTSCGDCVSTPVRVDDDEVAFFTSCRREFQNAAIIPRPSSSTAVHIIISNLCPCSSSLSRNRLPHHVVVNLLARIS